VTGDIIMIKNKIAIWVSLLLVTAIIANCSSGADDNEYNEPWWLEDPYPYDMRVPPEIWAAGGAMVRDWNGVSLVVGFNGVWIDGWYWRVGYHRIPGDYDPSLDTIEIANGTVIFALYDQDFWITLWDVPERIEGFTMVDSPSEKDLTPGTYAIVTFPHDFGTTRYLFIMPHTGPAHADFTVGPPFGVEFEDIE
jgi:hypothetical protein